jgi:hypothetical protein
MPGDQAKVVAAMIEVPRPTTPPRRLLLGSDAYTLVHAALADRLAAFEAQQDVADFREGYRRVFRPAAGLMVRARWPARCGRRAAARRRGGGDRRAASSFAGHQPPHARPRRPSPVVAVRSCGFNLQPA